MLFAWHRHTHNALRPALLLSFLGAGCALVTALYYHRRDGGAIPFTLAMVAGLALHLWHVALLARRA